MSTIATQLNWGASYIVNDFYRRFIRREAPEQHYVQISKATTVLITLVSAGVTFYMNSIAGAWKLLIVTGAGTGLVLLLRWYWWRINAWSEVSAMICAFLTSVTLQRGFGLDSDNPVDFAWIMIITVAVTTAVWLTVTFLTPPEPMDTLVKFFHRARPGMAGWRPVARLAPEVKASAAGWQSALDWLSGCVLIYGFLFGTGKLLLGETALGIVLLLLGLAGGAVIWWDLSRRGWSSVVE
jgi:SSS family solute:Na+ symporter